MTSFPAKGDNSNYCPSAATSTKRASGLAVKCELHIFNQHTKAGILTVTAIVATQVSMGPRFDSGLAQLFASPLPFVAAERKSWKGVILLES